MTAFISNFYVENPIVGPRRPIVRPICGGHRNVNQHENYLCVYLLGEFLAFLLVGLSVTDCGLNFNPPANLKSLVLLKFLKST